MEAGAILTLMTLGLAALGCSNKGETAAEKPVEKQVIFVGAGGLELPGTVLIPAKTPAPFVVLYPGSGPTDRNGNQLPAVKTDLLKDIAEHLAAKGIGSLRYDKRVTPGFQNKWDMSDMGKFQEFISWGNHKADAKAAFEFMKSLPESDDAHCGIIGHSEGGLQASAIAADLNPAAVVLLGTPGRPLKDILIDQIDGLLVRQKADETTRRKTNAQNQRIINEIIEKGTLPKDVPPGLAPIYQATTIKFLHDVLGLDPRQELAKYKGPVLVMNGEKDLQISVQKDAEPLFQSIKGEGRHRAIFIIPDASHNFKAVKSEAETGFDGPVVPIMLEQLTAWLKENL